MAHDYTLNSFHKKIIETLKELLSLDNSIDKFIDTGTQPSLDELCKAVEDVDNRWESVKLSLIPLIKIISGGDDVIDGEETDKGIKL